jgi:hypothetical protein
MSILNGKQTARIAEYIKMFKSDRETLEHAWYNTFDDGDDLDDLREVLKYINHLKNIVLSDKYNKRDKEFLKECEMIYQQWLIINKTK